MNSTAGVAAAVVPVQWLRFGLCLRDAPPKAAGAFSFAANVVFTGIRQSLAREMAQRSVAIAAMARARPAQQRARSFPDTHIGGVSADIGRSKAGIGPGISVLLRNGIAQKLRGDVAEADLAAAEAQVDRLRRRAQGETIAGFEAFRPHCRSAPCIGDRSDCGQALAQRGQAAPSADLQNGRCRARSSPASVRTARWLWTGDASKLSRAAYRPGSGRDTATCAWS